MINSAYNRESYDSKDPWYFQGARADIVDLMPPDPRANVLEVGCSRGATGRLAKAQGKAGRYVGVELHAPSADAASMYLDRVVRADAEALDFESLGGPFNTVIISEVLEHLVEPWNLVQKLYDVLAPGGRVFASSPNISSYRVLRKLIVGSFDYQDSGVMDRTHLRWFTIASFERMFVSAGFKKLSVSGVARKTSKEKLLGLILFHRLDHIFVHQIFFVGCKPGPN